MIPQELIARKRDGGELTSSELGAFLAEYGAGRVGEEQMAAFLMAAFLRGLTPRELATLTDTMLRSGEILDLGHLDGPRVDKHSTGGVGDKVSLVLAPLAAEMGMFVPMMSGRGLGHTGGTLDKLESIEGFDVHLPLERFTAVVQSVGCAMIGQTDEIAPLDRRLYALRDITGTVPSIPLITASIMSKKLAEGLSALVLDVKVGSGAFVPELEGARRLARTMVDVGAERGLPVRALLTAMDRPLGRAVGHGLEVAEALDCLAGAGPADLREVTLRLAAEMAVAGGLAPDVDEGRDRALRALDGGGAGERFFRMVAAQGGPSTEALVRRGRGPAPLVSEVAAEAAGTVARVDPRPIGIGLIGLGGGRTRSGQGIDHRVGFEVMVRPRDVVRAGDLLAVVHAGAAEDLPDAEAAVRAAVHIVDDTGTADALPLVLESVPAEG